MTEDDGLRAPRRHPDATTVSVDDGAVVLSPDGALLHLNPLGGAIWRLLDGSVTVATLCADLVALHPTEDPAQIRDAVHAYVAELRAEGLLEDDADSGEHQGA